MINDKTQQVLEIMNNSISNILTEGVFVLDIKINTIEYYYDSDINKIKVRIKTTQNQNDKIFKNKKIQEAFNVFLQELANEINNELTNDKELEELINGFMSN